MVYFILEGIKRPIVFLGKAIHNGLDGSKWYLNVVLGFFVLGILWGMKEVLFWCQLVFLFIMVKVTPKTKDKRIHSELLLKKFLHERKENKSKA